MILLTVLMILLGSFYKLEEAIPTSLSRLSRPTIILDAGHGGEDGGAVGVDGIIEKDINLSIAQNLRDLLVMNGYTVVMTGTVTPPSMTLAWRLCGKRRFQTWKTVWS